MTDSVKSAYHRSRILDSAVDYAIFSMDLDGSVTSWNDGARRILGWSEAEVLGQSGEMIFTPEDCSKGVPEREMGVALKSGRSMDERWHLRRDGTRFWASGLMLRLMGESGEVIGLMKVMRDRTEKWLQEQRQLAVLKLGNDLSNPAAWEELASTAAEAVGISLNASLTAYCTEVGGVWTVEGGWRDPVLTHPRSPVVLPPLDPRVADGAPVAISHTGEQPVSFGDGVEGHAFVHVPVIENGRLVAVFSALNRSAREWTAAEIAFIRDVAVRTRAVLERRRAEAALAGLAADLERQVETRLAERNRLWFSTSDLMATVDPSFCLQELNPAWTRLLGWPPDELLGRPMSELIQPEEDRRMMEDAVAQLRKQQRVQALACRLHAKDGALRTVNFSLSPDGDKTYLVGRDITAQMDIEERLRQSQKMDALGQLTGGVAHDFNNLLTGITGSLDLLRLRLDSGRTEGRERFIRAAQGAASKAAALTHRLLAFARHQPLDPRPVNVGQLVAGMEDLLRRTLHEGIRLRFDFRDTTWSAMTDAHQLENAILNLAINARDAMPQGGELVISIKHSPEAADSPNSDEPEGDFIGISVTDTGTGMSPEVKRKVFEPFFTTKPAGQGTGLGLAMIYGFAQQTGGDIRIDSVVGLGTTVTLYLPRAPVADLESESQRVPDLVRGQGESVFVVEDDPTVRLLLGEVLDELGYRRIDAPDGEAALPIIRSDLHIDLLITDLGLPFVNGKQLAVIAREQRPGLKILFITGYADMELLAKAQTEENTWVFMKPVGLHALSLKLQEVLKSP